MHRRYLEEDVVPRLRKALKALEDSYLDQIVDLVQLPDLQRAILENAEELRHRRNAIEEGQYALERCLKRLDGLS